MLKIFSSLLTISQLMDLSLFFQRWGIFQLSIISATCFIVALLYLTTIGGQVTE